MSQSTSQVAIFFDYDNQKVDPRIVFDYAENFGWIVKKRAYGDWVRDAIHRASMAAYYVELIDRPRFNLSDKKGNDISITVDAMEVAFSRHNIGVFVFVTGDADFIPLVLKLKEYGKTVIVVSSKNNTSLMLAKVCDRFVFYENLVKNEEPPPLDRGDYFMLLARKAYGIIRNRGLKPNHDNMTSIIKHFDPSFKFEKTGFKNIEAMIRSIETTFAREGAPAEAGHAPVSPLAQGAGETKVPAVEKAVVEDEAAAASETPESSPAARVTGEAQGPDGELSSLVNYFIQMFEKHDLGERAVHLKKASGYFKKMFPNFKFDRYRANDFVHAAKLVGTTSKFTVSGSHIAYSRPYLIERGMRKMGIFVPYAQRRAIVDSFVEVYKSFENGATCTLNYLAREVYDRNKQVYSKSAIANIFTALKFSGIFEGVDSSYITYSQPMRINCPLEEITKRLDLLYVKRIVKIMPVANADFALLSEFVFGTKGETAAIAAKLEKLIEMGEIVKSGDHYYYRESQE